MWCCSCPFIASCPMWWGQVKFTPPRYCDVDVVHSLQVVPCGEVKSSVHLLDIVMLELSIHCKLSHVVRSSQVYISYILWCWSCPFIASCPMWWGQVKFTPPRYCDVDLVHSLQVVPCGEVKSSVHLLDIVMLELSIHCKLSHVVRSSQVYTSYILWCWSCPFIASCPMWWGQVKCTPPRYCDVGVVHSLQVVPCGEVKSSVHLLDIVMLKLSIHCKLSHLVRSSQVYTS